MEIPSELSIDNRLARLQAENDTAPGELGRDAFLQLLVSQLSNQDPLAPLQDHEFVAQLATFSSLEQLESINESVQASLLMNQSVNNSLATTLIGKDVLADGSRIVLGESGSATFRVELPEAARVTVLVRDQFGQVVRTIDAGELAAGDSTITWDGLGSGGTPVPEGAYDIEVLAADAAGNPVEASLKVRARVTAIRFAEGTGFVVLGDAMIPLGSVLEVLEPAG